MSHAYGQARFPDGLVLHFEYNGTCDVIIPPLRISREEVSAHWREDEYDERRCVCGRSEPVEIVIDYGGGLRWPARACRYCKVVLGPTSPPEEE